MKVIRNAPTQLIIENTPWMFSLLLGFMALIAVTTGFVLLLSGVTLGGVIVLLVSALVFPITLYFVVQRVQVILDTATNVFVIRKRTLLGHTEVTHILAHLSHAELDTSYDSDDNSQTHRPVFVLTGGMSQGHHPMTPTHQSGHGPARIVDAINTWINAARQNGHFPSPVDSTTPSP